MKAKILITAVLLCLSQHFFAQEVPTQTTTTTVTTTSNEILNAEIAAKNAADAQKAALDAQKAAAKKLAKEQKDFEKAQKKIKKDQRKFEKRQSKLLSAEKNIQKTEKKLANAKKDLIKETAKFGKNKSKGKLTPAQVDEKTNDISKRNQKIKELQIKLQKDKESLTKMR